MARPRSWLLLVLFFLGACECEERTHKPLSPDLVTPAIRRPAPSPVYKPLMQQMTSVTEELKRRVSDRMPAAAPARRLAALAERIPDPNLIRERTRLQERALELRQPKDPRQAYSAMLEACLGCHRIHRSPTSLKQIEGLRLSPAPLAPGKATR